MRLELASKVKPRGVGMSIVEQHEQDKKAINKAVKAADEPIDNKDLNTATKEKNRHNLDESTFNDGGKHNPKLFVSGVESLLLSPYAMEGNEGFVESVKNGAKELMRIIASFFTWAAELVFNRVERLNNRYRNLERRLKGDGVKLTEVSHRSTIFRLATTPVYPTNPEWVTNAVKDVESFYDRVMAAQDVLKNVARELPAEFSKEQRDNLVTYTTENFAKAYLKKSRNAKEPILVSEVLPGFRRATVTFGESQLVGYSTSMVFSKMPRQLTPPKLFPNANAVRGTLEQVKSVIDSIIIKHKSQSSLRREFEKVVTALSRKVSSGDEKGGKNAYAFYTWLISFQKKSINSPLMYIFSSLNAALDYCETCIK